MIKDAQTGKRMSWLKQEIILFVLYANDEAHSGAPGHSSTCIQSAKKMSQNENKPF